VYIRCSASRRRYLTQCNTCLNIGLWFLRELHSGRQNVCVARLDADIVFMTSDIVLMTWNTLLATLEAEIMFVHSSGTGPRKGPAVCNRSTMRCVGCAVNEVCCLRTPSSHRAHEFSSTTRSHQYTPLCGWGQGWVSDGSWDTQVTVSFQWYTRKLQCHCNGTHASYSVIPVEHTSYSVISVVHSQVTV
jgi:hypothetical protein